MLSGVSKPIEQCYQIEGTLDLCVSTEQSFVANSMLLSEK